MSSPKYSCTLLIDDDTTPELLFVTSPPGHVLFPQLVITTLISPYLITYNFLYKLFMPFVIFEI